MMSRIFSAALACALLLPAITGCGSTIVDTAVNPVLDEPETLALLGSSLDGAAKTGTHVYWSTSVGLARVSIAGGPTETLLMHGIDNFAVDDTHVYYVNGTAGHWEVMKAPIQGGAEVTLAKLGWEVDSTVGAFTAVNETAVYFGDDNGVKSVPIEGGEVTTLSAGWPGGLALDATFLYWTDPAEGTVKRRPLDGSEKETVLATGQTDPLEIAVSGSTLCWLSKGQVHRASTDGSGAETTFDMGMPRRLAVDADHVYWLDEESGELRRMPLAGGEIATIAVGQIVNTYGTTNLWADDTSVYWLARQGKQIALKKLPK